MRENAYELPDQIVDILDAAVRAACTEWRDLMCRVASEDDAAVPEFLHAPALKRVDADPFERERMVGTKHRLDARNDALRFPLFIGIRLPAELKVDAPDVVRLSMQQRRLLRMERRIEPEPAFGRKLGFHLDVGDQETVAKDLALRFETEHLAYCAARAVRDDHVLAREGVASVGCFDLDGYVVVSRLDADDAIAPARVHASGLQQPLDQELLEMKLLEVDEGRMLVAA